MQAIIFDLDGTLLDSRERIFWQFEELTREFDGAPASRTDIAAAMPGTVEEIVSRLVKNDTVPREVLLARQETLHQESMGQLRLYPGVQELLPILRRIGIRMAAVGTGSSKVTQHLELTGIRNYFDLVITDEHVKNHHPHPEGIELIIKNLGVKPEQTTFVGDTIADIIAAKRANLAKTIAITHGFERAEALRAANPTHLVEDIPSVLDVLDARVER
jgi:HAD superfamily hydrolase (TIGR01509 family)